MQTLLRTKHGDEASSPPNWHLRPAVKWQQADDLHHAEGNPLQHQPQFVRGVRLVKLQARQAAFLKLLRGLGSGASGQPRHQAAVLRQSWQLQAAGRLPRPLARPEEEGFWRQHVEESRASEDDQRAVVARATERQ